MAFPIPSSYLQTNDIVVGVRGDNTVIVLQSSPATGTTAARPVVTTYVAYPYRTWLPVPRKPKPDTSVYSKLSGALRNQRCPKCGQKFKVCGHAPTAGPTPGRAG